MSSGSLVTIVQNKNLPHVPSPLHHLMRSISLMGKRTLHNQIRLPSKNHRGNLSLRMMKQDVLFISGDTYRIPPPSAPHCLSGITETTTQDTPQLKVSGYHPTNHFAFPVNVGANTAAWLWFPTPLVNLYLICNSKGHCPPPPQI